MVTCDQAATTRYAPGAPTGASFLSVALAALTMSAVACSGPIAAPSPSLGSLPTSGVPTPEAALTAHIPELLCPTTYGLAGKSPPPIPATQTATLTPGVAALVSYYANGALTLLGPKGWRCDATVAIDGSAYMAITPPGQEPASASAPIEGPAVTASATGRCVNCVALLACSLFPEARDLFTDPVTLCPSAYPIGERVTRAGPQSAEFIDPPGLRGSGSPSGGRYRAIGFIVFNPGSAAGGRGPSAVKVTCTLPDTMGDICDELVEGANRQP